MRNHAALLVLSLLVGCDEAPTSPSAIVDDTWRLVSLQRTGSPVASISDPNRYTVFFAEGGRVTVRSDCNSCAGPYTLAKGTLAMGPLACTRAFCGETSLDNEFTQALSTSRSLSAAGDQLTIRTENATLKFRKGE